MKVPSFKNRRDVSIASAGFFTVLKTAGRTVAVRPTGGYRVLADSSGVAATSIEAQEQLDARLRTVKIPMSGDSGMIDRGQLRMGLIVVTAASLSFFFLFWIYGFHL